MKFRLPPDCLGVSLAGQPLTVAGDRTIEADATHERHLEAHDIVPKDDPQPPANTPRAKERAKR